MAKRKNRLSILRPFKIAAIGVSLCVIAVFVRVLQVYGPVFWESTVAVSFLSAWIPAVVGIVVAFVPDKDLEPHLRIRWRFFIAGVLVMYSFVQWHQATLSEATSAREQRQLLESAVRKSNEHSDRKFDEVRNNVDRVQSEVRDLGTSLSQEVQTTTSTLGASIGKVAIPKPPERPRFAFSLWKEGMLPNNWPITSESVLPDQNGVYHVQFAIQNISDVSAEGIEFWVKVCDECSFASEPKSFDRPEGLDTHVRHKIIQGINPGVTVLQDNSIDVRPQSRSIGKFSINFRVTCSTCGKTEQSGEFWIERPDFVLHLPVPAGIKPTK